MSLTIGLIREGRIPPDHRVALTPLQCQSLMKQFPDVKIVVQSSAVRCFTDEEYQAHGVPVQEEMENCDLLLGIKEVPEAQLIPGKTYMFFSHTIKKQPFNRDMLKTILARNIRIIDYELLKDDEGSRLLGFGEYAGIVGAHYALLMHGARSSAYSLPPAHEFEDYQSLISNYQKVNFPPFKVALAGGGRAGNGARKILRGAKIREVAPEEFRNEVFDEPVFTWLGIENLYKRKDGKAMTKADFKAHPEEHQSNFMAYAPFTDVLINAIYWDSRIPRHFEIADTTKPDFQVKTIADVTCDIEGSIPITFHYTNREAPYYGYDSQNHQITEPFKSGTIDVMAIENLPDELPKDASRDFGQLLMDYILPYYIDDPRHPVLERATIAECGKLTTPFSYLKDYVNAGS